MTSAYPAGSVVAKTSRRIARFSTPLRCRRARESLSARLFARTSRYWLLGTLAPQPAQVDWFAILAMLSFALRRRGIVKSGAAQRQ